MPTTYDKLDLLSLQLGLALAALIRIAGTGDASASVAAEAIRAVQGAKLP